jgi:hypothetical protein
MKLVCNTTGSDATNSYILPILLYLFGDVHALLTSVCKLARFQHLPYSAIKAWAGSDDLVVDSENSVAVAVGAWIQAQAAGVSRTCTKEQKQELSGLLRIKCMSAGGFSCNVSWAYQDGEWCPCRCRPGLHHNRCPVFSSSFLILISHSSHFAEFMLYKLPRLPLITHGCDDLENFMASSLSGTAATVSGAPAGWSAPTRKQLKGEELWQRATLIWDVPKSVLETHMEGGAIDFPTMYVGGAAVQLSITVKKVSGDGNSKYKRGVFACLGAYRTDDTALVAIPSLLSCKQVTMRLVPGAEPVQVSKSTITWTSKNGWGNTEALTFSSLDELDAHFVDGCFKLRLTIQELL